MELKLPKSMKLIDLIMQRGVSLETWVDWSGPVYNAYSSPTAVIQHFKSHGVVDMRRSLTATLHLIFVAETD